MTKKFSVAYSVYYDYTMVIEADSKEEALEKFDAIDTIEALEEKGHLASKSDSEDNEVWEVNDKGEIVVDVEESDDYVFLCNHCNEMYDEHPGTCDFCANSKGIRKVHKGDMGL